MKKETRALNLYGKNTIIYAILSHILCITLFFLLLDENVFYYTYMHNVVLFNEDRCSIHSNVDRVNGCPSWVTPVFIACYDTKAVGGVSTCLSHGVSARSLEVMNCAIKSCIMRISIDVADCCAWWVTAQCAILDLADFIFSTWHWITSHVIFSIACTYTLTILCYKCFSLLTKTNKRCDARHKGTKAESAKIIILFPLTT